MMVLFWFRRLCFTQSVKEDRPFADKCIFREGHYSPLPNCRVGEWVGWVGGGGLLLNLIFKIKVYYIL